MAVRGAQRAGCGIVLLATSEGASALLDLELTEAIVHGVPEDDAGNPAPAALDAVLEAAGKATALVVGPALGTGAGSRAFVEGILSGTDLPMVLDADGISAIAGSDALARRDAPTVITPHAGELGRLMGVSAKEVSARRLHYARRAAAEHGCCVLLKGADTLVVRGERTAVNSTGEVALATAGTGDVLSGMIGALLSRGMDPFDAARAGAWAHGRAARLFLDATGWPPESLVATDLLAHIPRALREIR